MRIGILVDHGIELRHFVLSDLAKSLDKAGTQVVILLTKDIKTPLFNEYVNRYDLRTIVLSKSIVECSLSQWESRLRSLRNSYKRLRGEPIYTHVLKKIERNYFLELLSKVPFIYKVIHKYGLRKIRNHYLTKSNIDAISNLGLDKLIMLEYGSAIKSSLGIVANHLNIECEVFLNTLKTIYINDFLVFEPSKLYCWTKQHKESYFHSNWYYSKKFTQFEGSPFHTFLKMKSEVDIKLTCAKYGIEDHRPLILYSLIFEKIYSDEHLLVERIYNYIFDNFSEDCRPQLAIRRNPFEESNYGIKYLMKNCPDLIICDHYWERDTLKSWSLQGIQGEKEWKALLYRAELLLNIPSMASIDAMMTNTRSGNIYFDENELYNFKVQHILESPFASLFSQNDCIAKLFSLNDIGSTLMNESKLLRHNIISRDIEYFTKD